jgi:hypothetical protein
MPRSTEVDEEGPMGVLTDLVVAPMSDAAAVGRTPSDKRPWPSIDVKGLGPDDLALLHCLVDGRDPDALVTPPEWVVNPFTKKRVAVTILGSYMRAFEHAPGDGEIVVVRLPGVFVSALAKLTPGAVRDLAQRWHDADDKTSGGFVVDDAAACLDAATAIARTAVERGHEVFAWVCP